MEPERSTSPEIIENIEVNVRSPSLKAGRIHRKDFRAFLLFAAFVILVVVVGAVLIVKHLTPYIGSVAIGKILIMIGKKWFGNTGSGP
jgi:hypothetical protein